MIETKLDQIKRFRGSDVKLFLDMSFHFCTRCKTSFKTPAMFPLCYNCRSELNINYVQEMAQFYYDYEEKNQAFFLRLFNKFKNRLPQTWEGTKTPPFYKIHVIQDKDAPQICFIQFWFTYIAIIYRPSEKVWIFSETSKKGTIFREWRQPI